jgi:hypothetical protein
MLLQGEMLQKTQLQFGHYFSGKKVCLMGQKCGNPLLDAPYKEPLIDCGIEAKSEDLNRAKKVVIFHKIGINEIYFLSFYLFALCFD